MLRSAVVCSLLAAAGWAAEHAVLTNGYVLRVDRHEIEGPTVRLFINGGTVEFPAALVERFEPVPGTDGPVPQPTARPAPGATAAPGPQELLRQAAERWGLPPEFVAMVAQAESAFRTDAVSRKGAVGLMQLMPGTAAMLGADPHDPAQNADAGARYLRELLIRYGHSAPLALAAYNAGPAAVDRHAGIPPYAETRAYVQRVVKQFTQTRE